MIQISVEKQPVSKRRKLCYDFLSTIDQTGELTDLFDDDGTDDIKHERLLVCIMRKVVNFLHAQL